MSPGGTVNRTVVRHEVLLVRTEVRDLRRWAVERSGGAEFPAGQHRFGPGGKGEGLRAEEWGYLNPPAEPEPGLGLHVVTAPEAARVRADGPSAAASTRAVRNGGPLQHGVAPVVQLHAALVAPLHRSRSERPSSAWNSIGGRSSTGAAMPTWSTGALVRSRMAQSAPLLPPGTRMSPVRASSHARSRPITPVGLLPLRPGSAVTVAPCAGGS